MNGYAAPTVSFSHEEKLALIDERSVSDVESESSQIDVEKRFPTVRWAATAKSSCKGLRLSSWSSLLLRTGIFLLPSFLHHRFVHKPQRTEKLYPTAYLDGMRGLAALFVFFCHYLYTAFVISEGWGHDNAHYEIWRLPFIRLFYSGPSMVCIFFVISGYALSLKPLKQIRSRSFEGFSTTMSSFIFRRFFRLYLPPMISTFAVLMLLRYGIYEKTRDVANDSHYMHNVHEHHPDREDTMRQQLRHWMWEMYDFVHIWGWEKFGGTTGYDPHLWTIPVEFRCSMMLFLIQLGTARLRTGIRFTCLAVVMWFVLRGDHWEMLLFICGMVIAEIDLIRRAHEPQANHAPPQLLPIGEKTTTDTSRRFSWNSNVFWTLLSVPALYLMSEPDDGPDGVPGWRYLGRHIPEWFSDKYRYWQMVGAIVFVVCAARSSSWQRVFNSGPVQYFGRISYAIYLMHGPVCHTAGFAIERWAWDLTGVEDGAYVWGFALASVFNVPLVIWAADVFWRAVDAPTVRFTKWLEERLAAE
ncbi:acyltransferase [Xylariaceae sp. FL0662B]|nr:acyltransferase [Xylariaceae sp. FL0662B]